MSDDIKQLVCPECKGEKFTIHEECCVEGCDLHIHCLECGNNASCWSTTYHEIDTDLVPKEEKEELVDIYEYTKDWPEQSQDKKKEDEEP